MSSRAPRQLAGAMGERAAARQLCPKLFVHQVRLPFRSTVLPSTRLPFHRSTVLPFYCSTIPQFYRSAILPFGRSAVPFCRSATVTGQDTFVFVYNYFACQSPARGFASRDRTGVCLFVITLYVGAARVATPPRTQSCLCS